jgi:DNA gyrase subunit A
VAVPARTRDTLYLFTDEGQSIIIPMHQVPPGSLPGEGPSLAEFNTRPPKQVVAGVALPNTDELAGFLFLVSRGGRVKRVSLNDLISTRGNDTTVMGFDNGDTLLNAFVTPGDGEVILVSAQGQAIRFAEGEVRPMGLPAAGVYGIKLANENDALVGAGLIKPRGDLLLVTEKGIGKRSNLGEYPTQGRYGQGVITLKLTKDSGPVAAATTANVSDRVMSIRGKDQIVRLLTLAM